LRKKYIQPSKLSQVSQVFFVLKKDGKKRIVQYYQYLNSLTIRNNYLLLLISDLINNIRKKKMFTKIDLRWGYNNIRIKEDDKQKILWNTLDTNNFSFLLFLWFYINFVFLSFWFSFGQWRGTWHCSHMTCHMMWCHRPRT